MTYVPLTVRTEYSFFDSLCRVHDLVERARALGFDALGVADLHETLALPRFALAAREAGLRPLLGARLRLLEELPRRGDRNEPPPELVLFAADTGGYRNLLHLVSLAHLERGHDEPGVTLADLENAGNGLVALDGGREGPVYRAYGEELPAQAERLAAQLREVFGMENFFLQLQRHGESAETLYEPFVLHLARRLGLRVVAANDTRYLDAEEARQYEVLHCFAAGRTVADPARRPPRPRQHLRSPVEMQHLFRDLPEVLEQTRRVAERCQLELQPEPRGTAVLPTTSGRDPGLELRLQCERAACDRYGTVRYQDVPVEARDRIAHELENIEEKKLASCFLLVQDVARHAKEEGISCGPGRGSLAGSLVAHLLGITPLDPLAHGLLFERFLSRSRRGLPEFELEVEHHRREELLDWVRRRLGGQRVAALGVVERLSTRGAVRLAATALGSDAETRTALARVLRLPEDGAWSEPAKERAQAWNDPRLKVLLEISTRLEGLAQRLVASPSGLLLAPAGLHGLVALERQTNARIVAQATSEDADLLGCWRLHVHGSRHASLQAEAVQHRQRRTGASLDLQGLSLDDESTYRLLARGATLGIPQLESPRMQGLLRQAQPARFSALVALLAGERGGVQERASAGALPAATLAPAQDILQRTRGELLYEEQWMQLAAAFGHYDLEEADSLRVALVQRQWGNLAAQRARFLCGAVEGGITLPVAEELFTRLVAAAGSLACEAHVASQALLAYRSAYLAAHHPLEFFTALLNHEVGQPERHEAILREAVERQVRLLDVDIQRSASQCRIEDEGIRLGLTLVRHIGAGLAERIIEEREQHGPFRSLQEFRRRLHELPQRALESLIGAGAFASLGTPRTPVERGAAASPRPGPAAAQMELPFGEVETPGGRGTEQSTTPGGARGRGGASRRAASRTSHPGGRGVGGSPRLWIVGRIRSRHGGEGETLRP